jgi:hypothetical protein
MSGWIVTYWAWLVFALLWFQGFVTWIFRDPNDKENQ